MHPPLFPTLTAEIAAMVIQNAPAFMAGLVVVVEVAMFAIYRKIGKRNV
jgi:hypothetical protein